MYRKVSKKVRTRFPPEPNGLLHVGHAKAINLNFNYARENDGVCFLRYDDTNPTSEEDSFVRGIQEMVEWLGFKPLKITYASDYFSQLYEMAEKLIDKDLAYVCHEPLGAAKYRSSPWRFRNKSESLNVFREMKDGKYKEGEATLRLKMTTDDKIVDPVAYRIKHAYHHRTNNNWCIYPTYDYAHGLCDSLEDITHSFCPAEFSMKRSTYYWVCNAVGVYCPVQIEYGRLNFLNTVVSNRKITSLIKNGFVQGWDDPRLYTLAALRRRGYPPEVINEICSYFGFRRVNAYILPKPFHSYVRKHLENTAPRIMAVFNPLKILIVNYPWSERKELNVANVSRNKSSGFHTVTFDKEIWIEKSDFQEVPEEEFYRLTRDQYVGLKYTSHVIKVQEIVRKPCGSEIDHLRVECIPLKEVKKPRAYIHWVANPREAEARLYENL
ncbi:putative glutamine--tRNA ligase [Armadillidium nasatum]|uniref:glutamine--tRNA ligase n=1 Tax=Armadillidium nasatum TaxID=96803 RepID=A0A5N5T7T6_9CRUS|nr:putative glutamine--tRNA ligase [Armadillidium nasatum]